MLGKKKLNPEFLPTDCMKSASRLPVGSSVGISFRVFSYFFRLMRIVVLDKEVQQNLVQAGESAFKRARTTKKTDQLFDFGRTFEYN
ncbi:MAG: hypothetical protein DLD55_02880 [candidate division SR1 bacterium]|nr:MAG: hypothetical protein DLD55_02880 [candidate division SR1 bacterium]